MTFTEDARVPWTWWLIGLGLIVSLVVAVFAYVPPVAATVFIVANTVLLIGAMLVYTLHISFDGKVLRAGPNTLEAEYISGAEALVGEDAQRALGVDADIRNFLVTRPYVKDVVRVTLDDPADPHPAWLVSSRRAQELADVINEAVAR